MVKVFISRLWRSTLCEHIGIASWSSSSLTSSFYSLWQVSSFGKFIPWRFYSLTSSSFGKFIPWHVHPKVLSSHGTFNPWCFERMTKKINVLSFYLFDNWALLHQVPLTTLSLGGTSSGSSLGILVRLCQVQHLQQVWRTMTGSTTSAYFKKMFRPFLNSPSASQSTPHPRRIWSLSTRTTSGSTSLSYRGERDHELALKDLNEYTMCSYKESSPFDSSKQFICHIRTSFIRMFVRRIMSAVNRVIFWSTPCVNRTSLNTLDHSGGSLYDVPACPEWI